VLRLLITDTRSTVLACAHSTTLVMTSPLHHTVLQVSELIDQPGVSRRVDLALPVPAGLDLPLVQVVEPVRLTGEVAGVVEGLLVRGCLHVRLDAQCARCLVELKQDVSSDVAELFSDPRTDLGPENAVEEGYEIVDGTIDLDTLVRDALVPAVPYQLLCDAACRGLCPRCGSNRNEVDCACPEPAADSRWAALESLRLPGDGST